MIRLYVLAALATLSIPVLIPQRFQPTAFPSQWVPVFMSAEILITAGILKAIYPQNDFIRCVVFGLIFLLVRLGLCFLASVVDPAGAALWAGVEYRWIRGLVPATTYMYSAWYVTAAQYVALLLWLPGVFELLLPGIFPPRVVARVERPVGEATRSRPRLPRTIEQPMTFPEMERELQKYPDLLAWMVFSPDRLPVWRAGKAVDKLEQAPAVLHRLGESCEPLLQPEWGRTVTQGVFQTDSGCCVLATLPGGFLFGSLWRVEPDQMPAGKVLEKVLDRMERWLTYRFLEPVES